MKKAIILLLLSNVLAFSQVRHTDVVWDLSVNASNSLTDNNIGYNDSKTETTEISFNTSFGYCFSNSIIAGVNLGSIKNKYDDYETKLFQYGAYLEYVNPLSDLFSLSARIDLFLASGEMELTSSSSSDEPFDLDGFGLGLTPCLHMNVTKWFGLKCAFGGVSYMKSTMKIDGESDENLSTKTQLQLNQDVKFGVFFVF